MQLLRNKRTNALIEVLETEAIILSDPKAFRDWITALLKEKEDNIAIHLFTNINSDMVFNVQNGSVLVKDVLAGQFEVIPNTEVSRLLYGNKNPK